LQMRKDFDGCELSQTKYCARLNMPSCKECAIKKGADIGQVKADLDHMEQYVSQQELHAFSCDPICQLCAGEQKNPRTGYALLNLLHAGPRRKKTGVVGLKATQTPGTLVPLQIPCCDKCKKNITILQYLPILMPVLTGIIVLLLFMFTPLWKALMRIAAFLPVAVFLLVMLLSALGGQLLAARWHDKKKSETHMNPLTVSLAAELTNRGWFPLRKSANGAKIIFIKENLDCGVYTGVMHAEQDYMQQNMD